MLSKISEDRIIFLQQYNDVIYLLAENDNNKIILLTQKNDNFCQIGNLDIKYEQVKDVSISFKNSLLGVFTTFNELFIFHISPNLPKMYVYPNSIEGETIKFIESGKYICCYDASKINNIWCLKDNVWIKYKVKRSNFCGLLDKFSHKQYFFKKEMDNYKVITSSDEFEFSIDKQNTDRILQNKLFKRKTENIYEKEIENKTIKTYKDHDYVVKAFNKETNLLAGVEKRESRIDIWIYENDTYKYLSTLDKHCGIVKFLCFSNDGEILISGSELKEIKVWIIKDNKINIEQSLSDIKDVVINIKISDDKKSFISIDREDNLIIWKTHHKVYHTGKKKKKIFREEYFNYFELVKFPYPFNKLAINGNIITIRINNKSHILFDITLKEFQNIGDINSAIDKYKNNQNELVKKNNIKQKRDVIRNELIKKNINSKHLLKTESYSDKVEVETEEYLTIKTEIIEFRKNMNKFSVPEQRDKNYSPIRRKTAETVDIVVGLDFGTSNTKIAYRRISTGEVKPIIFNHKSPKHENYFLPSIAAFTTDGSLLLGIKAAKYLYNNPDKKGIYNFKMLFVSEIDSSFNNNENIKLMQDKFEPEFDINILKQFNGKKFRFTVVSYLAYAMKKARENIIIELPNRILDISFNICIPVDYVNNNIVSDEFKKLIATAEFIEREHYEKHSNFEFIDIVYSIIDYDEDNTRVFDIPETVAEVASYTTSPSIKEGLHVLIDFGAGTTDISIFNIKNPRKEDHNIAFYASHIINSGFRGVDFLKESNEVEKIEDYIISLWEESHIAWQDAYNSHLRNDIDWKGDKVQIFISGGGANEKLVSKIFKKPRIHREKWESYPHPLRILPTPEDYINNKIQFHRFAVAYGLSNRKPKLGIGNFILPKDAPNDTPIPIYQNPYKESDDRIPLNFN